jgi:hypothetical protein
MMQHSVDRGEYAYFYARVPDWECQWVRRAVETRSINGNSGVSNKLAGLAARVVGTVQPLFPQLSIIARNNQTYDGLPSSPTRCYLMFGVRNASNIGPVRDKYRTAVQIVGVKHDDEQVPNLFRMSLPVQVPPPPPPNVVVPAPPPLSAPIRAVPEPIWQESIPHSTVLAPTDQREFKTLFVEEFGHREE